MSEAILQSIVTGIVAIALAWIALMQARLHATVKEIKEDVNGHTKLLLAATKSEATAQGVATGVKQERARTKTDLSTHGVEANDKGHD